MVRKPLLTSLEELLTGKLKIKYEQE